MSRSLGPVQQYFAGENVVCGGGVKYRNTGSQTHKFLWVSLKSSICLPLFLLLPILPVCFLDPSRLLEFAIGAEPEGQVPGALQRPHARSDSKDGPQISRTPPRSLRRSWTALGSSPAACVRPEILPDTPAPISCSIWTNCFKIS